MVEMTLFERQFGRISKKWETLDNFLRYLEKLSCKKQIVNQIASCAISSYQLINKVLINLTICYKKVSYFDSWDSILLFLPTVIELTQIWNPQQQQLEESLWFGLQVYQDPVSEKKIIILICSLIIFKSHKSIFKDFINEKFRK